MGKIMQSLKNFWYWLQAEWISRTYLVTDDDSYDLQDWARLQSRRKD